MSCASLSRRFNIGYLGILGFLQNWKKKTKESKGIGFLALGFLFMIGPHLELFVILEPRESEQRVPPFNWLGTAQMQ